MIIISINFRFLEAIQELKSLPLKDVSGRCSEIWEEYLAEEASCPVNIDAHSMDITKKNLLTPDRWSFDAAKVSNRFIKYD